MKQFILKTSLGTIFLDLRDKFKLIKTALTKIEAVGTLSNDILSTKLITHICASEMTFIDIGSHIGSIISEVQHYDSSIKVIGVEAIPEKIERLKKYFPSVEFFECALGDENKTVNFYINLKASGYSSLLIPKDSSVVKEIVVPLKKLDSLREFNDVDAMKIDVEGAELSVIKGAKQTIIKNKPIIMFESAPGDYDAKEDMWDVLTSLEYSIHLPNRLAHNDNGLSKEGFIYSHRYPRHTTNYFAVPSTRRIEFRDKARKILKIKTQ